MPELVLAGVLLLHGVTDNRFWDRIVDVIAPTSRRSVETLLLVTFAITLAEKATARRNHQPPIQKQILLSASSAWDGEPYKCYPLGRPQLTVLRITLAPYTQLEWHSHPMPSAAYITAGQAVSETVDTFHRGVAGREPVVLIVFYAGSAGMPLTQHPHR